MIIRRFALLMSENSFSSFGMFALSGIFEPLRSKMIFFDWRSAVLNTRLIVFVLLPVGHFISHSSLFIRISGVRAPLRCSGGISEMS